MALPFLKTKTKPRNQVVAIDLGSHMTKAVHLQRRSGGIDFIHFAMLERPENSATQPEVLGNHLKQIHQAVGGRQKSVLVALNVADSLLRRAEMPMVPVSDLRTMLKVGSKKYLQQELSDYVFDCSIIPPQRNGASGEPVISRSKCNVLVGGAQRRVIQRIKEAARYAGLTIEQIAPNLVGPCNAFESAENEAFTNEVVALVDMGFKNTAVSILQEGELMLSRVLGFGGDHLTGALAESLGIGYSEAEGIKVGLSAEVEEQLKSSLTPLARELRASIDFFEHQQDKPVSQVFVSGGTARSEFIVNCLQAELMTTCRTWNPAARFNLNLPPHLRAEADQITPQLAVALGVAAATLN